MSCFSLLSKLLQQESPKGKSIYDDLTASFLLYLFRLSLLIFIFNCKEPNW